APHRARRHRDEHLHVHGVVRVPVGHRRDAAALARCRRPLSRRGLPRRLRACRSPAAAHARVASPHEGAFALDCRRGGLRMDRNRKFASRRAFVGGLSGAGALAALGVLPRALAGQVGSAAELGFTEIPDGVLAAQHLFALPGKVPLIKKTYRPPNFETPVEYFRTPITPNKAFFVRWHLAGIPQVNAKDWVLTVGGDAAEREVKLSLAQLKKDFP